MNKAEYPVVCRDYQYEVEGILDLHSETGTEGGYWSLQDKEFIVKTPAIDGVFEEQKVFDTEDPNRKGIVLLSMSKDGSKFSYSSKATDNTAHIVVEWEDGAQDSRVSSEVLVESWSYDGLILLKNGDELTIFEKFMPEKIAWRGLVELLRHNEEEVGPELEHPFRIHHDQANTNQNLWAGWFLNHYPAKLHRLDGFCSTQRINGPFISRAMRSRKR